MALNRIGRSLAMGLAMGLAASPAAAQIAKDGFAMNAVQLKSALFGIEMSGFSPTYGFAWRECIQPDGQTLYETPEGAMKGRLTISLKGLACFAYEDDGYSTPACYTTLRTTAGFRFEGEVEGVFVAKQVVTGVKSCKPQELIG
jgi:hypothetical protein